MRLTHVGTVCVELCVIITGVFARLQPRQHHPCPLAKSEPVPDAVTAMLSFSGADCEKLLLQLQHTETVWGEEIRKPNICSQHWGNQTHSELHMHRPE